jgi:hypothetical protein
LWRSLCREQGERAVDALARGMVLGLAAAALAAVWERLAFTGLLNFSTDYRTTAMFWEMHVGGAAFDGFLALTVPFAVRALVRAADARRSAAAATVVALAAYACLTTFSRGVYLGIPVGLAVFGWLTLNQRAIGFRSLSAGSIARAAALAVLAMVAVYVVFREGGYRSLLALLATTGVALHVAAAARGAGWWRLLLALAIGVGFGFADALVAPAFYKGPYVVFAAVFAANVALLGVGPDAFTARRAGAHWALLACLAAAGAVVAWHWGGSGAFRDSAATMVGLLALAAIASGAQVPCVPGSLRPRLIWIGALTLIAGAVTVFAGGAYMGERLATSSSDLDLRLRHWRDGVGFLHGAGDWSFGKGLGRFPASYFFNVPEGVFPGSFALHADRERPYLSLAGPSYPTSWGDLFRVAQRVDARPGIYTAVLEVKAVRRTELHVEVCEQHLLYNGECGAGSIMVPESRDWRRMSIALDGQGITSGAWYAPRLAFFGLSVASSGQSVDIADVTLMGPDGTNVLRNGGFERGMERWIPISEKFHLPWHIKNLGLNVLFDQGLVGVALGVSLLAAALWRLALGSARAHPVSPALAAALVGFLVVGTADSLLDVPRLAFLYYFLLFAAFGLSNGKSEHHASAPIPSGRN